jgi:hypothetical protein
MSSAGEADVGDSGNDVLATKPARSATPKWQSRIFMLDFFSRPRMRVPRAYTGPNGHGEALHGQDWGIRIIIFVVAALLMMRLEQLGK